MLPSQDANQEPMISADALTKRFHSTVALDEVTLEIPDGAVFGLLGPNGAGKTTFLRVVMGFLRADSGQVDLGELSPAEIGYLPERAFYPSRFTVHSYLSSMGHLAGLKGNAPREQADRLLHKVNLHEARDQRIGTCSRGMLQRLGLAQALLNDPTLILLDEPARALDPAGQRFMREQVSSLHQRGKTILLCSHHLDEVARVCTHIAVLSTGRLVEAGPLDMILAPRAQVVISVGPMPENLPDRLASLASDIAVAEGQVTLDDEAVGRKAEVLRLLLDAGVDIRRLSERHATLEEVYLEATGR